MTAMNDIDKVELMNVRGLEAKAMERDQTSSYVALPRPRDSQHETALKAFDEPFWFKIFVSQCERRLEKLEILQVCEDAETPAPHLIPTSDEIQKDGNAFKSTAMFILINKAPLERFQTFDNEHP